MRQAVSLAKQAFSRHPTIVVLLLRSTVRRLRMLQVVPSVVPPACHNADTDVRLMQISMTICFGGKRENAGLVVIGRILPCMLCLKQTCNSLCTLCPQ